MKFEKKDIIFYIIMAAIVTALAVIFISDREKNDDIAKSSPSPSISPTESPPPAGGLTSSPTASPKVTPTKTVEQKPGIIAKEVQDYNYWFNQLDHQSRVLGIYDECGYIVPSNVTYKNNTLVMLDNTRSSQSIVLKIGKTEYSLSAGAWNTITLSSQTLPAKMQIFCKGIELGQIDLE